METDFFRGRWPGAKWRAWWAVRWTLPAVLLAGCGTASSVPGLGWLGFGKADRVVYEGEDEGRTRRVDIYYSAEEVGRPFRRIGRGVVMSEPQTAQAVLQERFRTAARRKGGHGVIILETVADRQIPQMRIVHADIIRYDAGEDTPDLPDGTLAASGGSKGDEENDYEGKGPGSDFQEPPEDYVPPETF